MLKDSWLGVTSTSGPTVHLKQVTRRNKEDNPSTKLRVQLPAVEEGVLGTDGVAVFGLAAAFEAGHLMAISCAALP